MVLSRTERRTKLEKLAKIEGFAEVQNLLKATSYVSVSPGICTNQGCDYTTEVEPDQRHGHCEECRTGTVQGALVLAGLV